MVEVKAVRPGPAAGTDGPAPPWPGDRAGKGAAGGPGDTEPPALSAGARGRETAARRGVQADRCQKFTDPGADRLAVPTDGLEGFGEQSEDGQSRVQGPIRSCTGPYARTPTRSTLRACTGL